METKKPIEEAMERILSNHIGMGYGRTTIFSYKRCWRELSGHLSSDELQGSVNDILSWLERKLKELNRCNRLARTYRRFAHILLMEMKGVCDGQHYKGIERARTPSTQVWEHVLNSYVAELKKEEKAKATICFAKRVCTKFILYLERQGCLEPATLSRSLVLEYQNVDGGHTTKNGKRAYMYRIRMFIRYLQRRNLVDNTLEYAVNTRYRIPQKVVTVIGDEQRAQVTSHKGTEDPLQNRAYAMAVLALYLGLRSSDIINLKFFQISWGLSTITITQQKTKATQVLPLTAVVGNAIADYVLHHRPESREPFVFVSHHAPFGKLTRSSCYRSSQMLIQDPRTEEQPKGLHIMRRSFASELLRNHVRHEFISGFLGHSNPDSINPYLGLDEERIGRCALDLSLIAKPGVAR
jgi:site-specific recombinase XerD